MPREITESETYMQGPVERTRRETRGGAIEPRYEAPIFTGDPRLLALIAAALTPGLPAAFFKLQRRCAADPAARAAAVEFLGALRRQRYVGDL